MFMTRTIISLGILAAASVACAFAAELPELDILELCKDIAQKDVAKWSQKSRLPQDNSFELAYTFCLQREVDAKRDARWRLRMLTTGSASSDVRASQGASTKDK